MPQNFIECDREQLLLMPPSLRDWLPEDHFAWTILGSVEEMDLSAFYADYCCMRTRAETVLRVRSSGRAWRTSRIA